MEAFLQDLRKRYEAFKAQNPKVRIRDAAAQLGVSEAELVATGIGNTATRLEGDFCQMLKEIPALGYVMALTRNEHAVHERKGVYENVSFSGSIGLVLGDDIDLRLFMSGWRFAFAVEENDRKSLQFFDKSGQAIHKIYLTEASHLEAYMQLVERYKAAEPYAAMQIESYPAPDEPLPDESVDVDGFRQAWLSMKDTHEFFNILRQYNLTRTQGLRLAPEGHAWEISVEQLKRVFYDVSEKNCPIMIFVGNRGCIQIHSGLAKRLVQTGPWFNVLDPSFNLHLRTDAIASAWVVRKPTEDGIVTGIELYDASGQNILLMFGKRKPGIPELELWRDIIAQQAQRQYA